MAYKLIRYKYDKQMTLHQIAKMEEISYADLREVYSKKTKNIILAVRECKEKQEKRKERKQQIEQEEKHEYYGKELRLREIAQNEGIDAKKLMMCFRAIEDPYKAVFMAKYQKQKIVNFPDISVNLYDLSLLIGVKYNNLINFMNEGMTIAEIKEKYVNQYAGENIKFSNGLSLLDFCIRNRLDYTYMYRAIHTYGKSWKEAIAEYDNENKAIPSTWIYKKYGIRFKELGITGVQQTIITKEMSEKQISLEEALEKCAIRKSALKNGISAEWAEILYSISKTREILGEDFHPEIKINENEETFLEECEAELKSQESTNPIGNSERKDDDIVL